MSRRPVTTVFKLFICWSAEEFGNRSWEAVHNSLENKQGNDRENAKEEESAEGKVSEVAAARGVSRRLSPGEDSRGLCHLNTCSQAEDELS